MSSIKKTFRILSPSVLIIIQFILVIIITLWLYTTIQISLSKTRHGVFVAPEEGMRTLMSHGSFNEDDIVIIYAGPNSFYGRNPHIWYVGADIRPHVNDEGYQIGGSGQGAGSFFLHVKDGWIHIPEGAFPEVVGFGMKLFGLVPENG